MIWCNTWNSLSHTIRGSIALKKPQTNTKRLGRIILKCEEQLTQWNFKSESNPELPFPNVERSVNIQYPTTKLLFAFSILRHKCTIRKYKVVNK